MASAWGSCRFSTPGISLRSSSTRLISLVTLRSINRIRVVPIGKRVIGLVYDVLIHDGRTINYNTASSTRSGKTAVISSTRVIGTTRRCSCTASYVGLLVHRSILTVGSRTFSSSAATVEEEVGRLRVQRTLRSLVDQARKVIKVVW